MYDLKKTVHVCSDGNVLLLLFHESRKVIVVSFSEVFVKMSRNKVTLTTFGWNILMTKLVPIQLPYFSTYDIVFRLH